MEEKKYMEEEKAGPYGEKARISAMIWGQMQKKGKELIEDRTPLVQKIDMVINNTINEMLRKPHE